MNLDTSAVPFNSTSPIPLHTEITASNPQDPSPPTQFTPSAAGTQEASLATGAASRHESLSHKRKHHSLSSCSSVSSNEDEGATVSVRALPEQKRRKITAIPSMRTDASYRSVSSNGYSSHSPSHAVRKAHVSHPYSAAANGTHSPVINGKSKRRAARTAAYRGHNREELTRILIQGLRDMGYVHAADTLSEESGYELEGPEVGAFRLAVLNGRWSQAERLLLGPDPGAPATTSENGDTSLTGLALAENADKHQMLFDIRQQKFLELLVQRNLLGALKVLREELAPLNHDTRALHRLSSLLMCTSKDLESQMKWPSDPDQARQRLLEDLANSIAPSVMIRDHRLAELLDQVKQAQINECLYHNSSVPPSLYSDHKCLQEDFPSNTWMILEEHTDEVYCVEFSPDGRYLATAGNDKTLIIHDTSSFRPIQKFTEHPHAIVKIAWSPDSRKVLTAENGPQARVWDVVTGRRLITVEHNTNRETKVTAGAWLPNSTSFVTGSHDVDTKMCLWSLTATDPRKPAFTWHGGGCRVSELAVTPDGKHLSKGRARHDLGMRLANL